MIDLSGTITGHTETLKSLGGLAGEIRRELQHEVHNMGEAVKTRAQQKLSGPVLKAPTGALKGSVNVQDHFSDTSIVSTVGVNLGTIPYARIHEFGGIILPKNGPYLVFKTPDGAWHKVKQVVMPERSYLRSSLAELAPSLSKALIGALKRAAVAMGLAK